MNLASDGVPDDEYHWERKYRIAWRSRKTGETGHGIDNWSLVTTQAICDELDKEVPEIHHYPEVVP